VQVLPIGQNGDVAEGHGYGIQAGPGPRYPPTAGSKPPFRRHASAPRSTPSSPRPRTGRARNADRPGPAATSSAEPMPVAPPADAPIAHRSRAAGTTTSSLRARRLTVVESPPTRVFVRPQQLIEFPARHHLVSHRANVAAAHDENQERILICRPPRCGALAGPSRCVRPTTVGTRGHGREECIGQLSGWQAGP
jgi:hypothetical protein